MVTTPASAPQKRAPRIAIIGAGMSGVGMAIRLRQAGIDSFHIYERRSDLGGTWFANTYPGLACDVPSRNYQYTFAPNPDWSQLHCSGSEIWQYFDDLGEKYRLRDSASFDTEVTEARWEDGRWIVMTDRGDVAEYDFVISATGVLVRTRTPHIPGLETFAGDRFHSAEWDHSVDVAGKRIGVIGTGSTGLQLTKALAPIASSFELYQRTPQWILPWKNFTYPKVIRAIHRRWPELFKFEGRAWDQITVKPYGNAMIRDGWQRRMISGACRLHLRTIRDPELRKRFTPDYQPGCKRLVIGSGFYKLFQRDNVDLVDTAIVRIEPDGIVTADGKLHELDVLVMATGFDTQLYLRPMELIGADGTKLSQLWDSRVHGYRSVALPGFPNLFTLIGPQSPFGNQSLFGVAETQIEFAMNRIHEWTEGLFDSMSPTTDATERFNQEVRKAMPETIWVTGGCDSWYMGPDGTPTIWPWSIARHKEMLAAIDHSDWAIDRETSVNGAKSTASDRL
ncbi:flavin-containing monooxygenase [Hoyosella subflava]|uniref:Monooxygenase n=1 Tax=Hoyosella subflava (strain DSM 45089 / JCM 17490 / NBRC 109087 / DQS3-9A1) TaxID=443218 RepID=F6EQI7_HOYSD|nr:NAD(P)/FAD-dependent oxidoreductase [Hoyosella subflava]AEF40672.1 Monooxygenase [Hoyosella subflava DQS3-9A1]